jgi:hypothetical protein
MIFAAFGLLAVALALLIAAIIKSSVAFGIAALIATIAAGVFIILANAYYRKLTREKPEELRRLATDPTAARNADGSGVIEGAPPGVPAPMPAYAGNGHGMVAVMAPPAVTGPPVDGYDALTATQAVTVVETLGLDDLHGLRRWEIEHAARKTVLTAIDKRIQSIVEVRKQISSFEG